MTGLPWDVLRYNRRRMATKHDKLTPAARAALEALAAGATVTAAAKAVKVSRQTVSDWLNHNPAFNAELTQRRAELWGQACDRMRALLPVALDRIEAALHTEGPGSLNAALALIRMAKVEPQPVGPVESGVVQVIVHRAARE